MPKWKRLKPLSLNAYSNRSAPIDESSLTPAPYPKPLPGLPLTPAGSPKIVCPLSKSEP